MRIAAALSIVCASLPLWPVGAAALAQGAGSSGAAGIYSCTDQQGRRITSDRPIAECTAREQRVLNRDGSLKAIYPPILTVEERSDKESRERRMAEARATRADAVRRDRNLLVRYPSAAPHDKARESALDTVRAAIKTGERRLQDLQAERKPLNAEAEFYKGRQMPAKLRAQLDAIDASEQAQREAMAAQQAELERVNRLYDDELARLKQLWAGAAPGSLGPIGANAPLKPVAVEDGPKRR